MSDIKKKIKWSSVLLTAGMVTLLAGAVMSVADIEPYADYVLVAGAVLIIFRGTLRSREKIENTQPKEDGEQE